MKLLCFLLLFAAMSSAAEIIETDVCVYGGTAGGVAAAVQAARMGKSVALAEFGQHLGGMTSGGLGATDIGNKGAIGGIAREFYERIAQHYAQPSAWKFQSPDEAAKSAAGQERGNDPLVAKTGRATKWTFEPHVAEEIFAAMARENKVRVFRGQRLASVKKDGGLVAPKRSEGGRITEIAMEGGNIFRAKMFIDATYEGDLMARAGVSYHVGREANATYGETLNGICAHTPNHQFKVAVDPFVKAGDPASGLLPLIQSGDGLAASKRSEDGGNAGDGDRRVQAYNFRLCITDVAENRVPFPKPARYDPARFELLARYLAAQPGLKVGQLMNPIRMPNGKTDTNNNGPFSTDFIGMNYDYPDGDYSTREKIIAEHRDYNQGFLYFLAHDPRVPKPLQEEMNRWGLAKDEFTDTDNWPHQLYVREARRMISAVVMTENHCRGKLLAEDSVALAAYNMDSHNCQRIAKNGRVENEGNVEVPPMKPYPISYRAIVPKQNECENLFVPVCLSSSHIAYGSIRMEPVFMILGQSAATAACLALEEKMAAQKLDYAKLRARLLADQQILEWRALER